MNVETLQKVLGKIPDDYEVKVQGKGSRVLPNFEVDMKNKTVTLKTD